MKYPIGEQDFGNIRKSGCVYVDKTRFLEKMIREAESISFWRVRDASGKVFSCQPSTISSVGNVNFSGDFTLTQCSGNGKNTLYCALT